ncbi:zona pellucida-binding protein 2-like [Pseudonaja textilis]|uniref:zona pellucida-binding protein 2-like n=1 Tax=Pseudonaja textilis TaxID=8673 RepID=UPI000EA8FDB7|nr:zona pellucida-binding protein 2-like [Pseudonaja textilis]
MSMSGRGVGVALGAIILFLWERPGCALFHDLDKSDNETSSGQAPIEEKETELTFVHIGAKEFTLPCKPEKTDVVIGMNPTYNWNLENGENLTLHSGASLILHEFRAEESGRYTCSISFTEEDQLHTISFSHTVVGYHIRGELQVLLIFQSNSCDKSLTREFVRSLHKQLSQLVSHLHCELLSGSTTCFPTVEQPLDEFNLQVELKVTPFGKDWDKSCYPQTDSMPLECYHSAVQKNLQEAKEAMTEFMDTNKNFSLETSNGSHVSFVNTFFNFLEDGKCQEGYGQTQELQSYCPDCCTFCPPGTYSVATTDSCVLCPIGSYSLHYGTVFCISCDNNWLTSHPGARTSADCMNMRVPPSHRFSVVMIAFVVPPLGCLCLIVIGCYCFRHHWQKCRSAIKVDGQTKVQEEAPASATVDEETKVQEEASASANDTALVATEERHSLPITFSTSEHPKKEGGMSPPPSKQEPRALPGLANPSARGLLSS